MHIQQYATPHSFSEMPEWLGKVIGCAKHSENQRTQLVAVNVLIKIIQQSSEHNSEDPRLKNMYQLQQLISP